MSENETEKKGFTRTIAMRGVAEARQLLKDDKPEEALARLEGLHEEYVADIDAKTARSAEASLDNISVFNKKEGDGFVVTGWAVQRRKDGNGVQNVAFKAFKDVADQIVGELEARGNEIKHGEKIDLQKNPIAVSYEGHAQTETYASNGEQKTFHFIRLDELDFHPLPALENGEAPASAPAP